MNYNSSTQERIGDLERGMMVKTGNLEASTYLHQNTSSLFNVYGTIKVIALFGEITEAISANAATLKYAFVSTDPVIAVADMSAASGSLSEAAVGLRVTLPGADVTTATAITATPGISYNPTAPMIIGTDAGTGAIQITTAGAD